MTIFACIVSYNPSIDRLVSCVSSIRNDAKKVLIFDNGSNNIIQLEDSISQIKDYNIILIKSNENVGLANALQYLYMEAKKQGADWILTLDQDSVCPSGMIATLKSHCSEMVGAIAPLYYDERRNEKKPLPCKTTKYVDFCITSGSLTSVSALDSIGGFDTNLFIGLIDNDLCYRLRKKGYFIVEDHSVILDHELGNIIPSKARGFYLFLFKVTHLSIFRKLSYKRLISPMRTRFEIRNMLYLNKKHMKSNIKEWSNCSLRKTIISSLFRSKFRKEVRIAIKQGKKEGKELIAQLQDNSL